MWNQDQQQQGPRWWYCPSPRTPPTFDHHGEIIRQGKPCETNFCFECVPHTVGKVEAAIHHVEPQWLVTINDVGMNHSQARANRKTYRRPVQGADREADGGSLRLRAVRPARS